MRRSLAALAGFVLVAGMGLWAPSPAGADHPEYRQLPDQECPDDSSCAFPTPADCRAGDHNGVWDGGVLGRGAICVAAEGSIVVYTGGNANTPCGTIIVADQNVTGDDTDPNTCT